LPYFNKVDYSEGKAGDLIVIRLSIRQKKSIGPVIENT
jgi:hypothetical protein